jgi:drug/metabolite transporter (DMT)-like permease
VAVLGEPLTAGIVAAFVLILAGSVLATRPSRPSARPAGLAPADESVGGAARH